MHTREEKATRVFIAGTKYNRLLKLNYLFRSRQSRTYEYQDKRSISTIDHFTNLFIQQFPFNFIRVHLYVYPFS